MLLAGELNPGDKVDVDVHDGGLRLAVSPRDLPPEPRRGPEEEGREVPREPSHPDG
jgi:hypothetical protein